jgi:hypothetical protein
MTREEREGACERALFNAKASISAHLRKNWRGRGAIAAFNDEQARRWMRYAASSSNPATRRAALALQKKVLEGIRTQPDVRIDEQGAP